MSETSGPQLLDGSFQAPADARIAIVGARFNAFIVDRLVEGALDGLARHGVSADRVTVAHTPGAFEVPLVVDRFARSLAVGDIVWVSVREVRDDHLVCDLELRPDGTGFVSWERVYEQRGQQVTDADVLVVPISRTSL